MNNDRIITTNAAVSRPFRSRPIPIREIPRNVVNGSIRNKNNKYVRAVPDYGSIDQIRREAETYQIRHILEWLNDHAMVYFHFIADAFSDLSHKIFKHTRRIGKLENLLEEVIPKLKKVRKDFRRIDSSHQYIARDFDDRIATNYKNQTEMLERISVLETFVASFKKAYSSRKRRRRQITEERQNLGDNSRGNPNADVVEGFASDVNIV